MPKKSKRGADRIVRRKLADGTVQTYKYPPYRKTGPRRTAPDTMGALIRDYMMSPRWMALKPASQKVYRLYLRSFEKSASVKVKKFIRRDILTWRDAVAFKSGPAAANLYVSAASALFSWAVRNDRIERSPVYNIEPLEIGTRPAWTEAQAATALARLPERLRRAVLMGIYTGQRRGDLCAMTWAAYDGTTLTFAQEKSKRRIGRQMVIPVHPVLKAEMDRWKADRTAVTILTNSAGRPWRPGALTNAMRKALDALGMPEINVHGMRKLFAATLANRGASANEIAASTGHRTLSMVQLYTDSADQQRMATRAIGLLGPDTTIYKRKKP